MQKLLLICLWIYIYLCSQFSEVCLEFLITISSIQFAPIFISQLQHKSTFEKLVSFYFSDQNRYSIASDHGKFDGQMLHLLLDLWKAVIAVTILKTANFRFEVARQKRKYSEAGLSWLVQAGNDSRPRKEAQWSKLWKFISDKS